MKVHTYVPVTTASQRRLLFATWEETGDVTRACRTAYVGRRTFYYWKPRFRAGSYAALEQCASRAPGSRPAPHLRWSSRLLPCGRSIPPGVGSVWPTSWPRAISGCLLSALIRCGVSCGMRGCRATARRRVGIGDSGT